MAATSYGSTAVTRSRAETSRRWSPSGACCGRSRTEEPKVSNEDIVWMPGHEMAAAIRTKKLSPVEAVSAVLEQLEKVEPHISAFVTVVGDRALEQAREAEKQIAGGGELGPLHGVPITVKDLGATAGVRTTYGAAAFR